MNNRPPSDWKLERYLLGELPAPEMENVRKAVESDSSVSRRLEQLRLSDQDILGRYPPEWMISQIQARILAKPRRRAMRGAWWFHWQPLAGTAALVLVLTVLVFHMRSQHPSAGSVVASRTVGSTAGSQRSYSGTSTTGNKVVEPLHRQNARVQAPRAAVAMDSHVPAGRLARESFPRQEVFPSVRVTEEDHLLLAYARAISDGTAAAVTYPSTIRPLEIPILEIPTLELPKLEISLLRFEPLPGEMGNSRK